MTMTGKKIYNSDGRSSEDKALDKFAEMMIEKIKTLQNDWKKPWFTDKSISWPRNLRKSRLCRMTGRSLGLQINPSLGQEIFLAANTME